MFYILYMTYMLKSTRHSFILMSMLHRIFYFTCTTHVYLMGYHIVRAIFIPDLYYKLA